MKLTRRLACPAGLTLAIIALASTTPIAVRAVDQNVTVAIDLDLTGGDAEGAALIKDGAQMALDEANDAGGVAGYRIKALVLDNGTATTGQADPAQAATNARKMVADPSVVAAVGPQGS